MTLLHSAVNRYRAEGLCLIPVPYGTKDPVISWTPYKTRQPTDEEINSWFNGHETNLAVVCGQISGGLVIIDFDQEDEFVFYADAFHKKTGSMLVNSTRLTHGSRGGHVWFRVRQPVKSSRFPNCEIRSDGNIVILPPSLHPSGCHYEIDNPEVPIMEIDTLADVGIDLSQKRAVVATPIDGDPIPEGQRNAVLTSLAGTMRYKGASSAEIEAALLVRNHERCNPPLPENEVRSIAVSVGHYPPGTPYDSISRVYPESNAAVSGRDNSVTDSVTKYQNAAEFVTPARIEEWVKDTSGWFSYEELDRELGIKLPKDKDNRRQIIHRLKVDGKVEAHPRDNKLMRFVNVAVRVIDFKSASLRSTLAVRYPFGIEKHFNTYPGNIVVVAGAPDAGKTAFLLNFVKLNMFDFSIYYQSSEMGKDELASRLENFEHINLEDWNFIAEERSHDFADVIRPDCINIIDYLELSGDFYMVADYLKAIHDKLSSGIALVALQKKPNADTARGGYFSLEKPRLYLNMDQNKLKIRKAKNWTDPKKNPNGLVVNFKLVGGCKFIVTSDWHKEEDI
jgi:hypothetical protein